MEILGLLDTLEAIILDSAKLPFTKKVMVDEDKILSIIDKIRLVAQGNPGSRVIGVGAEKNRPEAAEVPEMSERSREESKAVEVIEQAYQMAKEIREGADRYADEVLANLEATSSRILRTIKAGRDRLTKTTQVGAEK